MSKWQKGIILFFLVASGGIAVTFAVLSLLAIINA